VAEGGRGHESEPAAFLGVILAGGASRRMGTSKADLVVDGQTLLARTLSVLRAAGASRVLVIGAPAGRWLDASETSHASNASHAWEASDAPGAVRFEPDDHPGEGPLPALLQALGRAQELDPLTPVFVVACDHPRLDPHAVATMVAALRGSRRVAPSTLAAVPARGARLEPLHAAYLPACAHALGASVTAGERSLVRALSSLSERVVRVELEAALAASLDDVDTPDDLARLGLRDADLPRGAEPPC
jgi:molybdenum cofactor guanylyltransferase